ncbi:Protein export cytoplasm protein SecA ATPase RNA helicase [Desulfosporosinus metallidurans]|uniref:Protein export cytoplasm protein SecA ATPase RNA helicase n=1 Tax=Desulfosporosinus metallidurans TaxID=1888891 RepID=A0A1Q8QJE7_9FIRM|nr:Protein export cytoplasm protein SecA ATPase RNA helicase [Desulfosporosinus metallidurans]
MIAAEINTIRHQAGKILLAGAIEIGRPLKEAKDLLPYGEWGKWLKESVSYSQRTAERLMQFCEEYGTKLLASPDSDGNPNSSPVTNLTYTQALILLGIPEEEREEFIAEHDVETMTKLELQQAVKDRDQAIREKKDLQKDLNLKSSELTQLTTQNKSPEQTFLPLMMWTRYLMNSCTKDC